MIEVDTDQERPSKRRLKYGEFAATLREHPGRWAEYPLQYTNSHALLAGLRNNENRSFPADEFEFERISGTVVVRFVGRDE